MSGPFQYQTCRVFRRLLYFIFYESPFFLGPHHMEFIFDLLVLPEGPRLRDKLSHGEVDLSGDEPVKTRLKQSCHLIMASIHDLVRVLTYINRVPYFFVTIFPVHVWYSSPFDSIFWSFLTASYLCEGLLAVLFSPTPQINSGAPQPAAQTSFKTTCSTHTHTTSTSQYYTSPTNASTLTQ